MKANESIEEAYQFLVDRHCFTRVAGSDEISYLSPMLEVRPSFSERDGYDTRLVYLRSAPQEMFVGTILASLDTFPAKSDEYSWSIHKLQREASFIWANLEKLIDLSGEIYGDCCALRFWHSVSWREAWGTTIVMDAQSIAEEKARLKRIQEYFENVPSAT